MTAYISVTIKSSHFLIKLKAGFILLIYNFYFKSVAAVVGTSSIISALDSWQTLQVLRRKKVDYLVVTSILDLKIRKLKMKNMHCCSQPP